MNDDDVHGDERDERLCAFPSCARRSRGIFCWRHRQQLAVLQDYYNRDKDSDDVPPRAA